MSNGNVHGLAEKIAGTLESDTRTADLSFIQAGIERINARLDKLESKLAPDASANLSFLAPHPSTERFSVIEAIADEIITNMSKEKACTFEPNGKPCDHCSMCSSRGF